MPGGEPIGVSTFGYAVHEIVAEYGGYSVTGGAWRKVSAKCPKQPEMHTSIHTFMRPAQKCPRSVHEVSTIAEMDAFGHLSTRLAERKIEVSRKVSKNPAMFRARPRARGNHVVYGCWHNLVQSVQKVSRSANRAGQFCAVLWREPKKCPKVSKTADSGSKNAG